MNKELQKLLKQINDKKNEVKSLVNDGKLDKANLHSNMFLLFPLAVAPSLYAQDLFTFQYVSIISTKTLDYGSSKGSFTFQYVSIIS